MLKVFFKEEFQISLIPTGLLLCRIITKYFTYSFTFHILRNVKFLNYFWDYGLLSDHFSNKECMYMFEITRVFYD